MKEDIASRLEAAGFEDYVIDYERGFAVVFFRGLLAEETPRQTEERRRLELQQHMLQQKIAGNGAAKF